MKGFPTPKDLQEKIFVCQKEEREYPMDLEYHLFSALVQAREAAGLTQEHVAQRMGCKRSAISRLESQTNHKKPSPKLSTLTRYAQAINYRLEFTLEPVLTESQQTDEV